MPFFSIIIPTYNRAYMLVKALQSVKEQTFSDWECIVVDDGSNDNTRELMQEWVNIDSRFRYIYQENAERSAARNKGIKNATGNYVCFLDSDDYYLPQRLELLNEEITRIHNPVAMFFTGICIQHENSLQKKAERIQKEYASVYDFIVWAQIGVPQACIAKEILLKHKFDPQFTVAEDMELWFRIANEYPIIYVPEQYYVIATEHDDRSVNIVRNNAFREVLKVFLFVRHQYHLPFATDTIKYVYSGSYFGMARFYIYNNKKIAAIYYMVKSILCDLRNPQSKYRVNIIFNIFFNLNKAKKLITN